MMLELPQRRSFATRDDFAAAVTASFGELYDLYEHEPVLEIIPDWAQGDPCVHSVSLPLHVAKQGGAEHGVSSVIKHAIELKKTSIKRLARVERGDRWYLFFEAN